MMTRIAMILLAAVLPAAALAAPVTEVPCRGDGARVALLIGNQDYVGTMQPLENPRRDIAALGALLCQHGFTVFRHADLDLNSFDATVEGFARAAKGSKTALVYYSGHGFAVGRRNWLVPVDARLGCEDISGEGGDFTRLKRRLIDLDDDVLSRLDGAGDQIVILDACRVDPVKGCKGGSTPSLIKGLVRTSASDARLIVYATQDGQVALDKLRGSETSPLVTAMLKRLPENSRRDWVSAMGEVSREVFTLTDRRQRPNIDFSLPPQGCLARQCGQFASPAQPAPSEAAQAWAATKDTTSVAVLEAFIRRFEGTAYADLARARLDELKKSQIAVVVPPAAPPSPPDTKPKPAVGVFPTAPGTTLTPTQQKITIGVSLAQDDNPFYIGMLRGIRARAQELGFDVVTVSANEDKLKQINGVQDLLAKGVKGILISPIDAVGVNAAYDAAAAGKIPIVSLARGSTSPNQTLHVAMDDKQIGREIAEWTAKKLGGKGKVAMLTGPSGVPTFRNLAEGYTEVMAKYPDIKIVFRTDGPLTRERGVKHAEDALVAHPDLAAIYTVNDDVGLGAMQGVAAANRKGKTIVTAMNGTPPGLRAVKDGNIAMTVELNPVQWGRLGVDVLAAYLKGNKVEPRVFIQPEIVDSNNIDAKLPKS